MSTRHHARATSPAVRVDLCVTGQVSASDRDRAEAEFTALLARHARATAHARVRLTGLNRPAGAMLVQANLPVCGAPARIQVAARTAASAIETATARLDCHIRRLTVAWEPRPWPDPERRVLAIPGHADIARLKTYRLHTVMPSQAAAVLNAMDYDAYLYTDTETGEDAILYRAGPTGLRLARQRSTHPPAMPVTLPLTINLRKVRVLEPAQAAYRLGEHGLPHLFFTDATSRRGNLLYRRYDGQLGLITPHIPQAGEG